MILCTLQHSFPILNVYYLGGYDSFLSGQQKSLLSKSKKKLPDSFYTIQEAHYINIQLYIFSYSNSLTTILILILEILTNDRLLISIILLKGMKNILW